MGYRAEDVFFYFLVVFFERLQKVFYVLSLRVFVRGAGVVNNRLVFSERRDLLFAYIYHRADNRDVFPFEFCYGRKGGKPAFVKERQKQRFDKVVGVMPESHLVAAVILAT